LPERPRPFTTSGLFGTRHSGGGGECSAHSYRSLAGLSLRRGFTEPDVRASRSISPRTGGRCAHSYRSFVGKMSEQPAIFWRT